MRHPDSVFDLFEQWAEMSPDAVAIIEGDGMITTYGALLQHAGHVSSYLQASGMSAEQPIGVMMSRTCEMVGVLLGILKSGAAWVPINTEDPTDRQRRYVAQSGIRLLITDAAFEGRADQLIKAGGHATQHFEVARIEMVDERNWPDTKASRINPAGLAYIMFTSGTTGEPKCVEIEHRNMLAVLQSTADMLKISSTDCFLAASSLSFDLSVADLFLPLIRGGRLLLRDKKCWTDAVRLAQEIREHSVNVIETTPALWKLALGADTPFPHVRIAITCGEAAQIALADQLVEICDQAWNFYGPTEGTVWCTAYHITKEGLAEDKHSELSISIGQPIDCAQVRVTDEYGQEMAHGQTGELWLTGAGLARGYRNDAAFTASKFVSPPGESVRYYLTGDLVSQDEDGNLRYFGRIDEQLQIHGLRIEPGDIESAIRGHEAVHDVAATWYNNATGSRSIVALVVRQDSTLTVYALHMWLSERLPKGMLPSHYVFTDNIPHLSSGKVDRRAIRTSLEPIVVTKDPELRKLTKTEEFVIEAWRHVLKMETISPTDHFFTIGGDSLSAVILVARLEASLNLQLADEFVYKNYTPEKMALRLDHKRAHRKTVNAQVGKRSLPIKLYRRSVRLVKRHILKTSKGKAKTLGEMLDMQRLYVSVWQGHRTTPDSLIVTLNPHGARHPLFLCMQAYWEMAELAKVLPNHPIHGMRSGPGVMNLRSEKELSALAKYYADQIQDIQPDGPLVLGGICFGARIMKQVAEHLQSLGREIEMLVIMEQHVRRKYKGRVHLIFGRESSSNPYLESGSQVDRKYHKLLPDGYTVNIVPGQHAELFRPANIQHVADILEEILVKDRIAIRARM